MKILYITTVGSTMGFFTSFAEDLIRRGNTFDIATNENDNVVPDCYRAWACNIYQISCNRSPFSLENIKAIGQIKRIVENGDYDIVHCHTPIASVCARIACKSIRKQGVKVFYTAHGFHFYSGAPPKNWLLFYPIERLCSRWTDKLITINMEDYELAKRHFKKTTVEYIPGVGIDTKKYSDAVLPLGDKKKKRIELGLAENEKMFLSVGELIPRKNHEAVIKALARIKEYPWKYYIAGKGELEDYLLQIIDSFNLNDRVFLLGFRKDIAQLCECADLFIFPSLQEGLPVALMEAIATKTAVVCSDIRGNIELGSEENLFSPDDIDKIKARLLDYYNGYLSESIVKNYNKLSKFSLQNVNEMMRQLYGIV